LLASAEFLLKLSCEIVKFNGAVGELLAWVYLAWIIACVFLGRRQWLIACGSEKGLIVIVFGVPRACNFGGTALGWGGVTILGL
jgi:hypothetical protein